MKNPLADKEGPIRRRPKPFYSCSYCKFYEENYGKTGHNPVFNSFCNHPKLGEDLLNSVFKEDIDVFRSSKKRIAFMSHNPDMTPSWCPYLQKNEDA